ncbi:unnamed protein product [Caenorhabditis angaria]|uniref:Uncharacterized protein n=1 Tax=Caenorhabditis angaria TaxID=860376 RepID=A0A9P1IT90_9PELO|nr:unnamed protein product [Caenorhabditis angaria]
MDKIKVPEDVRNYLMEAYSLSQQWSLPNERGNYESAKVLGEIREVAVIGGGTMGRGIAIACARAGYKTILVENDQKALDWCQRELDITYTREKQFKRLDDQKILKIKSALHFTTNLEDLKNCDLIIEAVFENMKLKKELFSKLDRICRDDCIFGTNTSSLDIDEMSLCLRNNTKLVGIHFFNPANLIKMVEIVYGSNTSQNAVATAFEVCKTIKKLPVLVGNCPAFLFNRLLAVYLEQTEKLLYIYGLTPQHVDEIVRNFGFLMGPLTMADMNGIDVMEKLKKENNWPLNPIETELLKRKRYGRKTNKGFYKYDEKTHKKENDMEVEQIIREISNGIQTNIQLICDQDVINFLLYPMVNEGFLCLEEGIIQHECLIDIMFILGFGWPPSIGGPMRFGRSVGMDKLSNTLSLWSSLEPKDRAYKLSETVKKAKLESLRSKI